METLENMTLSESSGVKRKCDVWKKRTLMERYLIVVSFLLCLVFILMVGLLARLIYLQSLPSETICLTPLCKNEAGRIISYMDLESDPCEDFYSFSCGTFVKTQPAPAGDENANQDYFITMRIWRIIKELIEVPDKENDPEFLKKVKKFYQSCVNSGSETFKLIAAILQRTKLVWPLLEPDRVNLEEALATVEIYENDNPLFIFYVRDDVLKIIPYVDLVAGGDFLVNTTEEKNYRKKKEYSNFLRYVLYKSKVPSHLLTEEVDRLIEVETMLAKIKEKHKMDEYDIEGVNSTKSELTDCEKLSITGTVSYIYEYFGKSSNFSDDTPIKIYRMNQVKNICEALNTVDDRVLYNYMVWFFLSRKLRTIDPYFKIKFSDFEDGDYNTPPKWEECIKRMLHNAYEHGLSYLALKYLQPEETLEKANYYVTEMKKQFKEMIATESWLDVDSREAATSQLQNISANMGGYSSGYLDEDLLNQYFSEVNTSDDYMENDLTYHVLDCRKRFSLFDDSLSNLSTIVSPLRINAFFTGDSIVLTVGILSPPFFQPSGPKFLNYAVTGSLIGHELIHAYAEIDKEHAQANGTSKWTNETVEQFIERKRCFEDQYSKFPMDDDGAMVNGTRTFPDNIADYGGMTQAFKAYEKYLKANGEEPRLPGLPYTNQQMFFLLYAQQWCEYTKSVAKTYKSDVHSPPKYRVIGPLQNSHQFSEAYKCPAGSPMNPTHKCSLFE